MCKQLGIYIKKILFNLKYVLTKNIKKKKQFSIGKKKIFQDKKFKRF